MAKLAKGGERSFQYQKRSRDDVKERANMRGGNFDTIFKPKFKQWKPKDGKNRIRILPPTWDDARHYGLDIFINYNIGPDNQSYLSLAKHGKGPDPLEEARREAQREGDKDLTKALSPNQRILYWIIDRADEDEGPLLWAAPFTFDRSLSNLCIDEDTKDVIFIDDPGKGRDVRFYKEGSGLTTKYDPSKMKVLEAGPIVDDEGLENEWLDFIADNPLPEVLNFYEYEHIKDTFDGQAGRKDEDDEVSVVRKARTEKTDPEESDRPARSRRQAPAEDEVTEVKPRSRRAEPEAEEEPAQPARRVRPRPEPEADEEPAPRRNRIAREPEPEEDDETPSPQSSRRGKTEAEEPTSGSLRERLAARRRRPEPADEED